MKWIEVERKKEELRNLEELSKLKLRKAELKAKRAQAEAAKAEAEAEIEHAETLARLHLENVNLEEKILECSLQSGSDMRTLSEIKSSIGPRLPNVKDKFSYVKPKQIHSRRAVEMKLENPFLRVSGNKVTNRIFAREPVVNPPNSNLASVIDLFETKPHVLIAKLKPDNDGIDNRQMNSANTYRDVPVGRPAFNKRNMRNDKSISQNNEIRCDENNYYSSQRRTNSTAESNEVALHTYRERQSRNEHINLASQIGYDGLNSAFIFL